MPGDGAKVIKSVGVANVTPTGFVAGLRLVIDPPLGSLPYEAKSPVPLPDTFQPGGPPETAGQGVCTGVTGGQKLKTPPDVKVNTPVQVALPFTAMAMAGMDSARNAPQAKPPSTSFFGLFIVSVSVELLRRSMTASLHPPRSRAVSACSCRRSPPGSCVLPLICIWFSEPIAEATGGFVRASPPLLVWLFGWITLLMPLGLKLVILYEFS